MLPRCAVAVAAVLLLTPSAASAQFVIDTRTGQNGGAYILGGPGSTAGYRQLGQSFTVPIGATTLSAFSFFLPAFSTGTNLDFAVEARVQAFDGSAPTGAVLFSEIRTLPPVSNPGSFPFPAVVFTTGTLGLAPGGSYVAYLVGRPETPSAIRGVGIVGESYAGGGTYRLGSGGGTDFITQDLAFVAEFTTSTVPEPAPFAMVGSALLAIGSMAGRRHTARSRAVSR